MNYDTPPQGTPDADPRRRDKKHPNPPLKGHKIPSVPPLVHQALAIAQKVDHTILKSKGRKGLVGKIANN